MVYRVIGLMSGSSLDGLDIVFAEFQETSGLWAFEIKASACYSYDKVWEQKLRDCIYLSAKEYQLLHTAYGELTGQMVNRFIEENNLQYQIQLIASHGHTSFHMPDKKMTAQLGDGAAIAATTGINVVSDLRAMDIALGGQGAPIVPIGEKLLFPKVQCFLNLGGIANLAFHDQEGIGNVQAFDICPANRVLNLLAADAGQPFDEGGELARLGTVNMDLLTQLNCLEYYKKPAPKSLANDFGTDQVYPLIKKMGLNIVDELRTYVEHICFQICESVKNMYSSNSKILITGGGAFNHFLIEILSEKLEDINMHIEIPEPAIINNKEALIMGLIGVLRWREENNVLASVTGAKKDSIGGAVWIGQDA